MIRPTLRAVERPYAEELRRCFRKAAANAISFPSPHGGVVFFSSRRQADAFEERLTQIENEFKEEAEVKKESATGTTQFGNRRDVINFEAYHGAHVKKTLMGEKIRYSGPFAIHLQFPNERVGWHVWTALHPKKPTALIEWLMPMMDVFEPKAGLHTPGDFENLRNIHEHLLQVKKEAWEHLRTRRDAIAIGKPSSQVVELEAHEKQYRKKRNKFLAGSSALQIATAAVLGWNAATLGLFKALMYQWTLGGWSIARAKSFSDADGGWIRKGIEPKHFMERELLKELGPKGRLPQRQTSQRREIIRNIADILQSHIHLHQAFIDHLDHQIARSQDKAKD